MDSALLLGLIAAVGPILYALGVATPKILAAVGGLKDGDVKRLANGYAELFKERQEEIDRLSRDMAEVKVALAKEQRSNRYCARWQERAAQWIRSAQTAMRKANPSLPFDPFEPPEPEAGSGSDVHMALTDPPSSVKPPGGS